MDAVLIGVVLLLGIGATFALGKQVNTTLKAQFSADPSENPTLTKNLPIDIHWPQEYGYLSF